MFQRLVESIGTYYLWIKAFHLIVVICWMSCFFYLPRLFVYHAEEGASPETRTTLARMEYRLYTIIMMPSFFLSLASGLLLATIPGIVDWSSGWFHLKLFCVAILVCLHYMLNYWRKALQKGTCQKPSHFFRFVNEIPTILLIVIIIAVVVKPF